MTTISAGIVLFRKLPSGIEVMLVHPGGPFWAKKDDASWSIPKGLTSGGEEILGRCPEGIFRGDWAEG